MKQNVLEFARPMSVLAPPTAEDVVAAQRKDLREVRQDATQRERYIDQLEADSKAQASVIAQLQAERPSPRMIQRYWLVNQQHVTLGQLVDALTLMESAGFSQAHYRPHKDESGRIVAMDLTVIESPRVAVAS
jgi:hypothetical protein